MRRDRARWLDDHSGPAVGARFAGTNKLGFLTWTTKPEIVEAQRGKAFAFKVPGRGGPEWRYDFSIDELGRTVVTESVAQIESSPLPLRLLQRVAGVRDRRSHLHDAMSSTLERLVATAEATSA